MTTLKTMKKALIILSFFAIGSLKATEKEHAKHDASLDQELKNIKELLNNIKDKMNPGTSAKEAKQESISQEMPLSEKLVVSGFALAAFYVISQSIKNACSKAQALTNLNKIQTYNQYLSGKSLVDAIKTKFISESLPFSAAEDRINKQINMLKKNLLQLRADEKREKKKLEKTECAFAQSQCPQWTSSCETKMNDGALDIASLQRAQTMIDNEMDHLQTIKLSIRDLPEYKEERMICKNKEQKTNRKAK